MTISRGWVVVLAAGFFLAACESGGGEAPSAPESGAQVVGSATVPSPSEQPPPDLSGVSLVDNLLVKERDGEWTRGEGLVSTLQLLAGEVDAAEVLRAAEVIDEEATGVIAMARDYLEDGPDEQAKTDITRLLDLLVFSTERLDAMAGIGRPTAGLPGVIATGDFQDAEEDCRKFFRWEIPPAGVGHCLEVRTLVVLDVLGEGPYRVFVPAESLDSAGWTEADYDLALEAMEETIPVLSKLDGVREVAMTPINLVFSVAADGYASADPKAGEECGVVLYTTLQAFTPESFKQVVAHELAHCFQTEAFVPQNEVKYEYIRWREEGLAEFLGNLVYPDNDLEWSEKRMKKLAELELKTTLFDRAYTNFMFFQFVHTQGGNSAIFALVDSLPTRNGLELQKEKLAAIPGIFEAYHEFLETVTDEKHEDTGGAYGPYAMTETNRPTVQITAPGTVVLSKVEPFGVLRRRLVVPEGKQACLTWDSSDLFVANRPNPEGEWVPLPTLLPVSVEETGDVDLVVTATSPANFALVVSSVHDLDEDQDGTLLGEWVVDNASLQRKVGYIAPVQILSEVSGEIRVTFRDDGTVRLVYNGFTVSGSSDVQLESGAYSTDLQSTYFSVTDAEGVDGYRITGDYIFYDSISEGNYLNGTQTIMRTRSGVWFGIKSGDIELEFELPEGSTENFPASGWAILGAANQLRFVCGGNILLLDEIILRRAD